MRRVVTLVSAVGAVLWATAALGNGGGYSFGVNFTGSVAPFQAIGTEHVRIAEEQLDIRLRRTDAAVVVRYTMKSDAAQPVKVRFGFPVEATRSDMVDAPGPGDPGYEEYVRRNLKEAYQQLAGYAVTAGGVPVKAEFMLEPFASGEVKPFPGSGALRGIAGWMVSEVTFPAEAPVPVEIRYAADYMGEATYVSDDTHWPAVSFVYRLSTGAVWKGPIERGTVTIRADGIAADEVEIAAPRGRFVRDGEKWVWSFQNLAPTLADDITIHPIPGFLEVSAYGRSDSPASTFLERAGKWGAGHREFTARASSTLASTKGRSYGPEHLAQPRAPEPWAEGAPGLGIGEWVEILPLKPAPLLAFSIVPGFRSDRRPDLFAANGRPSRIEVLLNGEHRFVATLGDQPVEQVIPIIEYAKPVAKLRITILEARRGTKYEDTCISSVVLYDRLKQKPDMRGAR